MIRKVLGLLICLTLVTAASLALAGGPAPPPAAQPYAMGAPGPAYYGPGGNPCAFWGDAPIPGLCGGVIALPFLVVGSLLGGNPMGPCGPPPVPKFGCGPRPYPPPPRTCAPPAYGGYYGGAGLLGGIPVFDLTSSLVGGLTGGAGLL